MAEGIEEEVRRLVREDDPRALEVLYDAVGAGLYAFLAARLRDPHEAEDVLQQVFLDLARRPGRLLGARCPERQYCRRVHLRRGQYR